MGHYCPPGSGSTILVALSLNTLLGWKIGDWHLPYRYPSLSASYKYFQVLIFSSVHEIIKLKRAWYDRERGSDLRYRAEGAVAGGGREAFPRQDRAHRRLASTRHQDLRRIISLPPSRGERQLSFSRYINTFEWFVSLLVLCCFVWNGVPYLRHFDTDPDPRNRTAGLRIRILVFSSMVIG